MEMFNSVNFENLIYMNLYSLLISNKIRIYIKMNNVKALKNMKLTLFPRRILSCKQDCLHIRPQNTDRLRRHDQSSHLVTSIAAALNWSGNAIIGGKGGGVSSIATIVCFTLGRRQQHVAQ